MAPGIALACEWDSVKEYHISGNVQFVGYPHYLLRVGRLLVKAPEDEKVRSPRRVNLSESQHFSQYPDAEINSLYTRNAYRTQKNWP